MTDPNHAEHMETVKAQAVDHALEKAHDPRAYRLFIIGMAVTVGFIVALGLAWLLTSMNQRSEIGSLKSEVGALKQTAQDSAAQARVLADDGKRLADQVRGLGATPVVQPPTIPPTGPAGPAGANGQTGRGITGTQIRDGHLLVSYTDGSTEDKGQVQGQAGATGAGGRSITSTTIANGHLVVAYSDGQSTDVGAVVGKDGATGSDGKPGRGVASVSINGSSHLIVTYTDGSTQDAGQLPSGPQGAPGPAGPSGAAGPPGPACPSGYEQHQARITADDGSSYDGLACVRLGSRKTTTPITPSLPLPGR